MNRVDIINNLIDAFPDELTRPNRSIHSHWDDLRLCEVVAEKEGMVTIGCEVEVRWSAYFPDLWDEYLANTKHLDLTKADQEFISAECTRREEILLPRLKATEDAGIPKGKDRYYEFANAPCYHPATLSFELSLLKRLNLIPAGTKHSLQITVGGLGQTRDAGMLLMAMELLGYTSPERITSAAFSEKAASWGRKGRAGLREREAAEMSLGASVGVELRTLELPLTDREINEMLSRCWLMANAIKDNGTQYDKWLLIVDELEELGRTHRIDTNLNWGRPWDNPNIWKDFAKKLPLIDNTRLKELVDDL